MMHFTWRMRRRIRHPFRRTARPALAKGDEAQRSANSPRARPAAPDSPAPVEEPQAQADAHADNAEARQARPAAEAKPEAPSRRPREGPEPEKATEPPAATQKAAEQPSEPERRRPLSPRRPRRRPRSRMPWTSSERERWLAKAQAPPADVSKLRVAGVLDEMSAACFEPDCDLLRIDSDDWAEALETHEPHLLLVESTWQGNNGSWQYMVASYTHPDYIGLPNLKALIAACRERDIPTVFWNKEDPVHFERFKEAAALFDYVFTSDSNCIDRYAALEREGTGPDLGAPVRRSAPDPQPDRRPRRAQSLPGLRRGVLPRPPHRSPDEPADAPRRRDAVRPPDLRPQIRLGGQGLRVPGALHGEGQGRSRLRRDDRRLQGPQGLPQRQLGHRLPDDVLPPGLRAARLRHRGGQHRERRRPADPRRRRLDDRHAEGGHQRADASCRTTTTGASSPSAAAGG